MKSEATIRKHRDNLRKALKRPCACAASGHGMECRIGGKMIAAVADALSWILGENEAHGRMVEEMDAEVNRL